MQLPTHHRGALPTAGPHPKRMVHEPHRPTASPSKLGSRGCVTPPAARKGVDWLLPSREVPRRWCGELRRSFASLRQVPVMTSTTLLPFQPDAMSPAQLAAVSYLARYSGHTHALYAYQLRRWFAWCETNALDPLVGVQRAHVEPYIRHLSECGLLDSTVVTMMHGVRSYFRFAHIDGLILSDPAVYARLPNRSPAAPTARRQEDRRAGNPTHGTSRRDHPSRDHRERSLVGRHGVLVARRIRVRQCVTPPPIDAAHYE